MWPSTNLCVSQCSCEVHPKHNMWPWLEVDYFICSKIRKCLHLPTLPLLVTSAENKWSLMAFFEFLVRGAAVSVFHRSEWCGPGSLEFLAGRSEALIYQAVLSVRCVHGEGNSDSVARTPAHTHTQTVKWSYFACKCKALSLIQEVKRGFVSSVWSLSGKHVAKFLMTHFRKRTVGNERCECPQRYTDIKRRGTLDMKAGQGAPLQLRS